MSKRKSSDHLNANLLHTVARYLAVGGVLFVVDLLVFLALHSFFLFGASISQIVARTVGAVTGFVMHKFVTFENFDGRAKSIGFQGLAYVFITVGNVFLSAFVLTSAIQILSLHIVLIKFLVELVMVTITFILTKLVFAVSNDEQL